MKKIIIACLFVIVPLTAEARTKSQRILSQGEPGTCSEIGGLWTGECNEDGQSRQVKLQIFQDGCTDLAFFDFDSPIPQVYKVGREARVLSSKLADSFANFSAYADWSDDRRTFQVSRLANGEYTEKQIMMKVKMEETYVVSLKGEGTLQTSVKGKISSSSRPSETYETTCSYHRPD